MLTCQIHEKHGIAKAFSQDELDDLFDVLSSYHAFCDNSEHYELISNGETDVDYIVESHFNNIPPIAGLTEVVVPLSALLTIYESYFTQIVMDLAKGGIHSREEKDYDLYGGPVAAAYLAANKRGVTHGTYTVTVIQVTLLDDSPQNSKEELAAKVFGIGVDVDAYNLVRFSLYSHEL